MTIRKKALLVTGIGAGVVMMSLVIIVGYIFLKQSNQLEDKKARLNIDRIEEAIIARYQSIDSKLSDWSSWDDTYKFIKDKNKEYVKSNVESSVIFTQFKLNFMIFLDSDSNVVLEKGYNYLTNSEIKIPNSIYDHLIGNGKIVLQAKSQGASNGILVLPEGPMFVAARPILTSDNGGPSRGILVFARYLDESEIQYLESVTKNEKIHIYLTNDQNLPSDEAKNLSKILENKTLLLKEGFDQIEGFQVINDVYGNPSLFIGLYLERDIYVQAINSIKYLGFFVTIVFLLFLFGIYFMFGKFVLDPLNILVSGVSKISNERNFTTRLDISSSDEVAVLAKNINLMLQVIEEMKKDAKTHEESLESSNKKLEEGREAILNILEDERRLEEDLKNEKKNVEKKVLERTKQLRNANEEINKGWLQIQQEKSKLLASIEALLKAYVMFDLDGNIILTNHNLEELFGKTNGVWTLPKLQEKLGASFDLVNNYKKCLETKERLLFKDQSFGARFLEIRISPVFEDKTQNKIIGVLAIIGDVTEEKVLARSRDEFFSIASHELRTPLTAIKGNASMILEYYKDKLDSPDLKEMVDDIHESSVRLIRIVNDFLNVSRLEQGRLEFKIQKSDILPIIEGVVEEYRGQVSENGLYLKFEKPEKGVPQVCVDPERVRQVVTNLVGNAIKFTKQGGITISLSNIKDFLKINVKDTGSGIPLANQNLLFHKFQQAGSSILTRDTAHGTGLGLYISKLMIEGMGGKIYLENSIEGKGSDFAFTLPLKEILSLKQTQQVKEKV